MVEIAIVRAIFENLKMSHQRLALSEQPDGCYAPVGAPQSAYIRLILRFVEHAALWFLPIACRQPPCKIPDFARPIGSPPACDMERVGSQQVRTDASVTGRAKLRKSRERRGFRAARAKRPRNIGSPEAAANTPDLHCDFHQDRRRRRRRLNYAQKPGSICTQDDCKPGRKTSAKRLLAKQGRRSTR